MRSDPNASELERFEIDGALGVTAIIRLLLAAVVVSLLLGRLVCVAAAHVLASGMDATVPTADDTDGCGHRHRLVLRLRLHL